MLTVLHFALTNAVVAAAMALLLLPAARWLRRPALTHALSLLILLKLVTPPLLNVSFISPAPGAAAPAPQSPTAAPPALVSPDQPMDLVPTVDITAPAPATPQPVAVGRWTVLAGGALGLVTSQRLAAVWFATSALYAAVVLWRIAKLRGAVCRATVPGEDLSQEVSRLARQLGLAYAPQVLFVRGLAPPMLLAMFGKARVLVPAALWERLDESKRQTLLLHELAHLRRRDHWVRYLELAATCIYWWHPAVWWARAALREAEEQCCDAWVIWAMPAARRAYMTTL